MASALPTADQHGHWLNIADASDYLGVSTKTIRRWIRAGTLRAEMRPGRTRPQYFVPVEELDERRPDRNATVSEIVVLLTDRLRTWEESLEARLAGDRSTLDRVERQLAALNQALQRRDRLVAASVLLLQAVLDAEVTSAGELPQRVDALAQSEGELMAAMAAGQRGQGHAADPPRRRALPAPRTGGESGAAPDFNHDLRLSLALISGYSQLLAREQAKSRPKPERMSAYVEVLRAQCDHLDQLLDLLGQEPRRPGGGAGE